MPRDLRLNPPIPALHPERDALLAAVRDADPADDLPALVYADWQDEHGQPEHAELIRVMVELAKARKQDKASKERRSKLLARMKELFKTPPLKPLREMESNTWGFSRGFIRQLIFVMKDGGDPQVLMRLGYVPTASIMDLPSYIPFDKLTWLGVMLPGNLTTSHVACLAAVPWLCRVSRIALSVSSSRHTGPGVLAPLIASRNLGGVKCFNFGYAGSRKRGVIATSELVALVLAKSATGLVKFPLAEAQEVITTDGSTRRSAPAFRAAVEQIVSAKRAKQFTSFGEEVVDVDEALAKILLASPHLKNIREFRYVFEKTTPKTQAAFVERFGPPERID